MTIDLLRTLREQVTEDRVSEALETVDDIEAAFSSDRATTGSFDTLATAVRYNTDGDSAPAAAANQHLVAATELEQRRLELNEAILGYLTDEMPPETLVDRIDATIDGYETLSSEREALLDEAGSVPVGVLLHLGPVDRQRVPLGGSVHASTTVANLGDEESGALTVTSRSDDLVSTGVSPASLDGLGSGDRTTVEVDVTGRTAGRGRVRVLVEGDDRASTGFGVEVLEKADYVSEALDLTDRLLSDVENRLEAGGASAALRWLQRRLEEIRRRLAQILARLEDDRSKGQDVDGRIESVIGRFEAVVETLGGGDATRLDDRVVSEYARRCRDAIDILNASLDAES